MSINIDWVAKKPPVYCRPHGRKIVAVINGTNLCNRCIHGVVEQLRSEEISNEKIIQNSA